MVMRFGMDATLGPVSYENPPSQFLNAPMPQAVGERRYSDETAHAIDQAVQHAVEGAFRRTVSILEANRDLLEKGAALLLDRETLEEAALRDLMKPLAPHKPAAALAAEASSSAIAASQKAN